MTEKAKKVKYLAQCGLILFLVCFILKWTHNISSVFLKSSIETISPVPLYIKSTSRRHSYSMIKKMKGSICPILQGGLGNRLFQFSTAFAAARSKNMNLIIPSDADISNVFEINETLNEARELCKGFRKILDRASPTYHQNLLNFSSTDNIQLGYGLQSWKYFYMYDKQLKTQLTFRKHIQHKAKQTIDKILQRRHIESRKSVNLVGVHIRRGDKVGNHDGFNIATPEYLNRSVNYYAQKYEAVLFIVISDGMSWSMKNMPSHVPVEYISLGKRELDMATVVACDHTIMTIGTFGWWIGYLTGGDVVYVKNAAAKGSRFEKILNFKDHFYPHWIGL
ncbi:galactoside alpha-(1,2)-fucosyltransferase 1-like isoform X2 [Mytilus californianus]|uniref:galactoside alpha-(1,2)-fucosyltransferase 1-like isoform X2 n=1 Tax=Mytilus californianus TaxID=6549 RepID=UPI002248333B|nr:galactoside alpha-(1,2)-fucosyltransferase 1-like isoform X2 [Mytilus californianus]XP_052081325.1 galactoside alpha-(1,2)-fucosyltransferase 1-like isoform X2 [Mytilus californianus]